MTTPPPPAAAGLPNSGKSLASMIVGIVAFLSCLYWFMALPGGIVAIILGVLGRRDAAAGTHSGGGMAMTGIILGAVAVILGLLGAIFVFLSPGLFEGFLEGVCESNPDIPQCADIN